MGSPSSEEHKRRAGEIGPVRISLVTVSDTRTEETDENGRYLKGEIADKGHTLLDYRIIPDEAAEVDRLIEELVHADCDVLIFNGGTGIGPRDVTIDGVEKRFEKRMPGFGEIFRMLSYEQVGSAAMLSRAAAGIIGRTTVICLPGSRKAVELGWTRLIEPELRHLVWEQNRSKQLPHASGDV